MTDNYTLPLSKAKAIDILTHNTTLWSLPRVGYEACVTSTNKDYYGFSDRLYLQNICGDYQLYCHSQPITAWKEVFKDFNFCGVI